jgi:hypothetical protein
MGSGGYKRATNKDGFLFSSYYLELAVTMKIKLIFL